MTASPTAIDHAQVVETLGTECRTLLEIYRLARRQRRHMVHRRVPDMAETVARIDELIPVAREAARRREALLEGLDASATASRSTLQEWVESVDTPWRERLSRGLRDLARVSDRLHSLNFQNFQLARYSLDLTQEEVRILVGENGGSSTYESDGAAEGKDRRGVVDGRA